MNQLSNWLIGIGIALVVVGIYLAANYSNGEAPKTNSVPANYPASQNSTNKKVVKPTATPREQPTLAYDASIQRQISLYKNNWQNTGLPIIANCIVEVSGDEKAKIYIAANRFQDTYSFSAASPVGYWDDQGQPYQKIIVPERFSTEVKAMYAGKKDFVTVTISVTCYKCNSENSTHLYWHQQMTQWFKSFK